VLLVPAALALTTLLAAARPAAATEETATRRETLSFEGGAPGQARRLRVCNVFGSITARGTTGDEVRLVVHERFSGDTPAAVARAKRDMALGFDRGAGSMEVYVGHPCDARQRHDDRDDDHDHAKAKYDFEIEVPQGVAVDLSTVLDGKVTLTDHRGPFRVTNVNGAVEATGISGSGRATTVNGAVTVRFADNPREACRFETVNGAVDVAFRPGLAADLRFKTLNGDVYSDFPYTYRSAVETHRHQEGGMTVLSSRSLAGIRVGGGGVEHSLTTVNGNIYVRQGGPES
jgi:hypothetical protein